MVAIHVALLFMLFHLSPDMNLPGVQSVIRVFDVTEPPPPPPPPPPQETATQAEGEGGRLGTA